MRSCRNERCKRGPEGSRATINRGTSLHCCARCRDATRSRRCRDRKNRGVKLKTCSRCRGRGIVEVKA